MRYVTVRVLDSDGKPVQGAKVIVWVYQALSPAMHLPEKYTNREGAAEIDVDYSEISISVNGHEKVKRGATQGQYKIYL